MARNEIMNMIDLVKNRNGAVMVMVLLVLVAAIILGVSVMRSTTIDTKIAGNERIYQQDFYASEAAGECTISQFDEIVSSMIMPMDTPLDVSASINDICTIQDADAVMTFKRTGNLPVGSGTSAANMSAYYYVISTTINGKTIQKGVWKAFPTIN